METVFGVSVACPAIVASNADTGLSPVGGLRHQSLMGRLLKHQTQFPSDNINTV